MTTTIVETDPRLTSGSGTGPMKRHIVKRVPGGVEDQTLCGAAWDRLNPGTGEFCEECLEAYARLRPGWPLPGRLPFRP